MATVSIALSPSLIPPNQLSACILVMADFDELLNALSALQSAHLSQL